MRIALFTDIYRPVLGGITESVVSTTRALKEEGVKTLLFAPSSNGITEEKDTIFFPTVPVPFGGTTISTGFPYSKRIEKIVVASDIDLIHSFSSFIIGHFATSLGRKYNIPTVLTYQSRHSEYIHFWPLGKHLLRFSRLTNLVKQQIPKLTSTLCNSYDCVIAPTPTIAEILKKTRVTTRIETIPVGFDIKELETKTIPPVFARLKNTFTLLYVGRLSSEKNLIFLLRAFARAIKLSIKPLQLVIVADGPQKPLLEKIVNDLQIAHHVTFTGAIPHEKIGPYYQSADSFVFSSLSDVQAIAVCEALSVGLPVIAVAALGPSDFIVNEQEGLLTACNEKTFAQAIIRMSSDASLRSRLSSNARKKGQQLFSLKKYGKSLVTLYESLLKK